MNEFFPRREEGEGGVGGEPINDTIYRMYHLNNHPISYFSPKNWCVVSKQNIYSFKIALKEEKTRAILQGKKPTDLCRTIFYRDPQPSLL